MQTLKQKTIAAISQLPDMAGYDDIMAVIRIFMENESEQNASAVSCFDLMKDSIGCIKGSEDLSVNKSHMEGYGK